MTPGTLLLSLAIGLALPVAAAAQTATQTGTPVDPSGIDVKQRMAMHAIEMSREYFVDLIEPGDILGLVFVSRQLVAAGVCDGFEVDADRQQAVMDRLFAKPMAGDPPNLLALARVMHGFGILKGGEMALATYDPEGFCTSAAELRDALAEQDTEGKLGILRAAN